MADGFGLGLGNGGMRRYMTLKMDIPRVNFMNNYDKRYGFQLGR